MAGPQPPLPPVPNRDLLLRLSYTQQAATYLHLAQYAHDAEASGTSSSAGTEAAVKGKQRTRPEADESSSGGKRRRGRKQHGAPGSLARLARSLASDIPRVTSHNKIRLDPGFKRALCKTCHTVLLPGLTAQVVNRPSRTHGHVVATTCAHCATVKTLPRPPLYPLPIPVETLLAPVPGKSKGKRKAQPSPADVVEPQATMPAAGPASPASLTHPFSPATPALAFTFSPTYSPPFLTDPVYSPPEPNYLPAAPSVLGQSTTPAWSPPAAGSPAFPSAYSPVYSTVTPLISLETPVMSPLTPARFSSLGAVLPATSPDVSAPAPSALALPLPLPAAQSPTAAPELRYNKRERQQMRLLARRSTVTEEDRAKGERFKNGKRRPGGAPAGYGTGGGLDILSEREGVGHWRQEGQQAGWTAI